MIEVLIRKFILVKAYVVRRNNFFFDYYDVIELDQ